MRLPGLRTALLAALTACGSGTEAPPRLILGSTHTLQDSGLLEVITENFAASYGDAARLSVIVAGSGEVLAMAARGDIDVVLSHSPDDERAFIAAGRGESRHPVMHNDFVLLGPPSDPAGVGTVGSAAVALRRIRESGQPFVSRGDDSGTHRRERALWAEAHVLPDWPGYIEAGSGMADALRIASQRGGYVLSDRATYEVLHSELRLVVLREGEAMLLNGYSVIVVSGARNIDGARLFSAWIRSAPAQRAMRDYRMDRAGRPLFHPDALEEP